MNPALRSRSIKVEISDNQLIICVENKMFFFVLHCHVLASELADLVVKLPSSLHYLRQWQYVYEGEHCYWNIVEAIVINRDPG